MQLLLVWAVAGGIERHTRGQRLEHLPRAVHGNGALVQRRAEIFLENRAVELNAQRLEYAVPAHALQLGKCQLAALERAPQFIVLPLEHIVHERLVGTQTEMRKAALHGLPDIFVKIEQRVVNVNQSQPHGVILRFCFSSA